MKLYFAPLEGITGHIYRRTYAKHFPLHIDKYFSPFVSPGVNQLLSRKELRDILPQNNPDIYLVPQILANNAADFLLAAKSIRELGYEEINLNLGCPSGTVVSKRKGSGMLAFPDELNYLLDGIYAKADVKVSVKTRIGKENPDEFYRILEIYNQYPIHELIIHPRVQKEFYKNTPHMEVFKEAVRLSRNPVCYNGDIVTKKDFEHFQKDYPQIDCIMIGRGFLRNPMLAEELMEGKKAEKERLQAFHDELLEAYICEMSGERPVLFKMKELWSFFLTLFSGSEKLGKKLRKAEKLAVYRDIVQQIFETCSLVEDESVS